MAFVFSLNFELLLCKLINNIQGVSKLFIDYKKLHLIT